MSWYPHWICGPCGVKHGRWPEGHLGTFHEPDPDDKEDRCGWCGSGTEWLTQPRDFCYPPAPTAPPKEK